MGFAIALGILLILLGLFEAFFASERYFRWFFRQYGKDADNYDCDRVKLVRGICVVLIGLLCLSVDLFKGKLFWLPVSLAFVILVIHFLAVFMFCKKR